MLTVVGIANEKLRAKAKEDEWKEYCKEEEITVADEDGVYRPGGDATDGESSGGGSGGGSGSGPME